MKLPITFVCLGLSLLFLRMVSPASVSADTAEIHTWDSREKETLRSLWLGSLPSLPEDPSNAHSDDLEAAKLGRRFFSDIRLSGDGRVACATCHQPYYYFTDPMPFSHGMGTPTRRSMTLVGVAYNSWFFWDGRADSLWAQALVPLESPVEHGISRTFCAQFIGAYYKKDYERIFGKLPDFPEKTCPPIARPDPSDQKAYRAWLSIPGEKREEITRVYVNMGKAIAAFVRRIAPGPSRFDAYVEALFKSDAEAMQRTLSIDEAKGLRLFIGKGKCINCHSGPLFTNGSFNNLGLPQPEGVPPDSGRAGGIGKVLSHEFNCLSKYSDARPEQCPDLRSIDRAVEKYRGAFKTPTLRNVADRPPYTHAGQFTALREMLAFYQSRGKAPALGHSGLTQEELAQIEAFLRTLSGPIRIVGIED